MSAWITEGPGVEPGSVYPLTQTTCRSVCTISTRSACEAITASIDLYAAGVSSIRPAHSASCCSARHTSSSPAFQQGDSQQVPDSDVNRLSQWEGLPVRQISFDGITAARLGPLSANLAQTEGAPLKRENLRRSLRQLFISGKLL